MLLPAIPLFVKVRSFALLFYRTLKSRNKVYIDLQIIDDRQQRERERKEQKEIDKKLSQSLQDVIELGEYLYHRSPLQEDNGSNTIDPQEALQNHKRIVILGAPGSGKSTILRWLARQAVQNSNEHIPILVLLREYATAHQLEPALSLRDFGIRQAVQGDKKVQIVLENFIQANNILWLLDGLDEARQSTEYIAREAANLPGQVIITSRPSGFTGVGLENFTKFNIQRLSAKKVNSFVDHWFECLANSFQDQSENNTDWIEERKTWLKTQLKERPQIAYLTQNPLFLTFLITLAGSEPLLPLPESRTDLYTSFITRLYNSWEERNTTDEVRQMALNGFALIGWVLHFLYFAGKPDQEPTREILLHRLSQYEAKGWHRPDEKRIETVLDFWRRAGMLETWPVGLSEYFIFEHSTFQEYAAGMVLKDSWERNPKKTWQFLRQRLHVPAWREPILFMACLVSDEQKIILIKKILAARSRWEKELRRDLQLAIRIACVQTQTSSSLTDILKKAINDMFTTKDGDESEYRREWVKEQLIHAFTPPDSKWKHEMLRQFLKDKNLFVVEAVVRALGKLGDWDGVLEAFKHEEFSVRREAIRVLRFWNEPQKVLPVARKAIYDQELDVRSEAFQILEKFSDRETLRNSLKSDLIENRWLAINCLSSLKDRDSLPAIRETYNDSSADVRQSCAWALGDLDDRSSFQELRQLLKDEDKVVCEAAAESLVKLGDLDTLRRAMKDENDITRIAVANFLTDLDDQELLESATKDKCKEVRRIAVYALSAKKRNDLLWGMIKDEDEDVRWNVISSLYGLKDSKLLGSLREGLRDKNIVHRVGSASLLSNLNFQEAKPILQQALYQEDEELSFSAAVSLGELGFREALPKLSLAVFTSTDLSLQESAIKALGKLGNIEGLPAIKYAAKSHDFNIRYEANEAVKQLAANANTPEIAKRITKEIRHFKSPEARNILAERLAVMELQSRSAKDLLLLPKPHKNWRQLIRGAQISLLSILISLGSALLMEVIKGNLGPGWLAIIIIILLLVLFLWRQWLTHTEQNE